MSIRIPDLPSVTQSIDPLHTYHFTRGLTLSFRGTTGTLSGGKEQSLIYQVNQADIFRGEPTQSGFQSIIINIERLTSGRLIAVSGIKNINDINTGEPESIPTEMAPDRTLFDVGEKYLSDADLGELLLLELNHAENSCRNILTGGRETEKVFSSAYETVLYWKEQIRAGQIGPPKLDQFINLATSMIKEAFFFANMIEIGESIRGSLLRANYHLVRMIEMIWRANIGYNIGPSTSFPLAKEIEVMRPDIDRIADEYTSAVIAAYSALDMLYEYFIFLTRQPFGEPSFPEHFHFPDYNPSRAFRDGGLARPDDIGCDVLPFAIPNLADNSFRHLRLLRNDLVHNMVADSHRPVAYIRIALPPVGGLSIQYTQYLCRDVGLDGEPLMHNWNRRFYTQQRDAQLVLYELIEQVWQCCFDTIRWISNRMRSMGI